MSIYDSKTPPGEKLAPGIPVPVAAVPPSTRPTSRVRRVLRFLLSLAVLAWLVTSVSRWSHAMLEHELDAHEGRWLGRAFSQAHAPGRSPRKVPYGKKAEKLFLYVLPLFLPLFSRLAHPRLTPDPRVWQYGSECG